MHHQDDLDDLIRELNATTISPDANSKSRADAGPRADADADADPDAVAGAGAVPEYASPFVGGTTLDAALDAVLEAAGSAEADAAGDARGDARGDAGAADVAGLPPTLRASGAPRQSADAARPGTRFERWLSLLVERRASDLLLVSGAPPMIRVDGRVQALGEERFDAARAADRAGIGTGWGQSPDLERAALGLSAAGGDADGGRLEGRDIEEAVLPALPPHAQRQYRDGAIADASLHVRGLGRFRINLHHERGRAAATIRALPTTVPRLASLGLPASIELLSRLSRGLVLVGGPTGAGKSTTLAALVEEINRRDARHIITIEDPIEYEHTHKQSVVEQVEIGVDAPDFPTALRAALRQAPDVIVVGEMRDPETMKIALAAGETGHLVLSSIHTTDIASTISRVADSFPVERQNTIRQELSMALAAVMTQTLLPKIGGGRVPAAELLMVSYGARQHVRKNALQHLHQEITITRKLGSFSFEESLARLVRDGLVERTEAHARALHPDEFENAMR